MARLTDAAPAAMHEMLEEAVAEAIATICGRAAPDAGANGDPADDGLLDLAANGGASSARAQRQLVDGGDGGAGAGPGGRKWWQIWKGESMGAEVVRRLGMQCVALALVAAVLWWRDMLPAQVKRRLAEVVPKGGTGDPHAGSVDEGLHG